VATVDLKRPRAQFCADGNRFTVLDNEIDWSARKCFWIAVKQADAWRSTADGSGNLERGHTGEKWNFVAFAVAGFYFF